MDLHLSLEHPISHELEAELSAPIVDFGDQMVAKRAMFKRDRSMLTGALIGFSGVSLLTALVLGLVLSWSFTRLVKRIDNVLSEIANGNFTQRIDIPNRDEFGALSQNLNVMSDRLVNLYGDLNGLNETLQARVEEQVKELERSTRLRRYLSPQLADSIVSGSVDVDLASRRDIPTIFFSDIRGFTELTEKVEPEELVNLLNQYLTAMTEIVFKYGGTLDKYIGDAIMVFVGDPVHQEDHAERAVKMAFEMRERMAEMQQQWSARHQESISIGMGISTGYVTVGNIGSSTRMDYTVMGNHVNLASRLADEAKPGQILVSERTLLEAQHLVDATQIDEIKIEGVPRPIKIYQITKKLGVA